jgi:hypothetical protein
MGERLDLGQPKTNFLNATGLGVATTRPNRRMRTRMSGGVGGGGLTTVPYPDSCYDTLRYDYIL